MAKSPQQRAAITRSVLTALGKSAEKRVTPAARVAKTHRRIESRTPSPFDPDERRYGLSIGHGRGEEW